MSFDRTAAIVLRQFYLMRGSSARVLPLFAWVAIDIVLWGFMTKYLNSISSTSLNFVEIVRRLAEVQSASLPWLVADGGGGVTGYAYATRWKDRAAYRFSVEITAYVAPGCSGCGIGSRLYGQLLPMLQAQHVHAAIGGIALPNDASVALHEKFGFLKVAQFREVGFKFNRWIDVGYWQRTL